MLVVVENAWQLDGVDQELFGGMVRGWAIRTTLNSSIAFG
jgi:hypothetical protein